MDPLSTCVFNYILYLLNKSFHRPSPSTLSKLYCCYVRPILEFASPVWSPYFAKDINLLERVQRRASRIPPGLSLLRYEDRLKILKLPTLYSRRQRGDLIVTFRALNNFFGADLNFFRRSSDPRLRGHPLKLSHECYHTSHRQHFWSCRSLNTWNSLPEAVVMASSINAFKNQLDAWKLSEE